MAHSLDYRLKHVAGLLAKYQSNPGLRSKLPDSMLTPEQRAARKRNSFLAGISNPGSTLAGPDLVNAATQITNSDFDPLLANIGTQEGQVKSDAATQGARSKSYYDTLNSIFNATNAAQGSANTAAVGDAATRGAATQGAIQSAANQAQARMSQDAAVRGAGLEGTAPQTLAAQTATQGAQAATEAQRAQQAATDTGGAQAAFLRGLQGSAAQAGGEAQTTITHDASGLLTKLAADRSTLQGQKAGALTDTLLKLRQQEADNAYTRAGLGLDAAKLAASSVPSASDQKTAADLAFFKKHGYYPQTGPTKGPSASDQKTQQEIDFFNKHGYYPTTGPPKKGSAAGGASKPGDVGKAQDAYGVAVAAAKQLMKQGITDPNKLRQALVAGQAAGQTVSVTQKDKQGRTITQKVDPTTGKPAAAAVKPVDALWASVAVDVLHDGHVSRMNAARLHARGLKVHDLGLPSYTDWKRTHPNGTAPAGGASQRPISGNPGAGQ